MPHALIAAYGGDTVAAALAVAAHPAARRPPSWRWWTTRTTAVATSVAVARALEGRLWGVRLDTSRVHGGSRPCSRRWAPSGRPG